MLFVPVIIVLLSVLVTILSFSALIRSIKLRKERARAFASELGLSYVESWDALRGYYADPSQAAVLGWLQRLPPFFRNLVEALSPWRVSGELRGVPVSVYEETRSSGKNSTTWLVQKAYFSAPLPFKFRAFREGAASKIGKALFNLRDVEIGDKEFDDAVRVVSDDPEAVRALFGGSVSGFAVGAAVAAAIRVYPQLLVDESGLTLERARTRLDGEFVRSSLDAMVSLVFLLEGGKEA